MKYSIPPNFSVYTNPNLIPSPFCEIKKVPWTLSEKFPLGSLGPGRDPDDSAPFRFPYRNPNCRIPVIRKYPFSGISSPKAGDFYARMAGTGFHTTF